MPPKKGHKHELLCGKLRFLGLRVWVFSMIVRSFVHCTAFLGRRGGCRVWYSGLWTISLDVEFSCSESHCLLLGFVVEGSVDVFRWLMGKIPEMPKCKGTMICSHTTWFMQDMRVLHLFEHKSSGLAKSHHSTQV